MEKSILGIDEAGRGCLAGPLSVGAVLFPPSVFSLPEFLLIQDSKKLSHKQREKVFSIVKNLASFAEVSYISNLKIDKININQATELAILHLLKKLYKSKLDMSKISVIIDGNFSFPLLKKNYPALEFSSLIKGDQKIPSISGASILAKVSRDRLMGKLHRYFPQYNWEQNKGYPSHFHRSQIALEGLSPFHRKSFCKKN